MVRLSVLGRVGTKGLKILCLRIRRACVRRLPRPSILPCCLVARPALLGVGFWVRAWKAVAVVARSTSTLMIAWDCERDRQVQACASRLARALQRLSLHSRPVSSIHLHLKGIPVDPPIGGGFYTASAQLCPKPQRALVRASHLVARPSPTHFFTVDWLHYRLAQHSRSDCGYLVN